MYAILDIETTGGKFNEEGITEIAIYRFDGHTIVDQFSSLVNPERSIQPFVVNLTGINSDMLKNAPKFYEIAKRVIEITEGCILVAHNADFDNRILTTEFDRLGYPFEKETLCTVELAKTLLPDLPSYSLGKLVRTLGIPISDRHRAQGDAKATVELFKLLLAKDTKKQILQKFVKKDPKQKLEPKLLDMITEAPATTGVYYLHQNDGKIIYIGKSKNIKKRITQHFTGNSRKSKKIQLEVAAVTFEKTGNELIALLKENEEIKLNKPKYNRGIQKNVFSFQLEIEKDEHGYQRLKVEKADKRKKAIITFTNYQQAKAALFSITEKYTLCQKLNGLDNVKKNCSKYKLQECLGACIHEEDTVAYNEKVQQFLNDYSYEQKHQLLIDRGREIDERSVILIENGIYKGYGFYNLNYQVNNMEILKSIINTSHSNQDAQHLIHTYLKKNKILKTIPLASKVLN